MTIKNRRRLVVVGLVVLLSGGLPLHPANHKVCSSGCDFTSIQAAVDGAASGDTIQIGAGTYVENVVIEAKSLTVEGAGRAATIVDGSRSGRVFLIATDYVLDVDTRLAHMTLRRGWGSAVCVDGAGRISRIRLVSASDNA